MPHSVKQIPTPHDIALELPISQELRAQVQQHTREICDILEGKDQRKLLIVGPCSAWPDKAVIEYAKRMSKTAEKVKTKIKLVFRLYTQKPRTHLGWTGPINKPDPFKPADIAAGIRYCRKMALDVLKYGFPLADEAVFTHNEGYFGDLLSYIAVGARSSEDQEHRAYASKALVPVGMKNPTSGDLVKAVNAVVSAQHPHEFLQGRLQVESRGNQYAHVVLRGGDKPNYDEASLLRIKEILEKEEIKNPSIIVDLSHDNSIDPNTKKKNPRMQSKVLDDVYHSMHKNPSLNALVKGFMMESFLKQGKQDLNDFTSADQLDLNGLSVTDSCLDINETNKVIMDLYKVL